MIITSADPKVKVLDDFDVIFTNGLAYPFSLDREAGDDVEYPRPDTMVIHLVAKPSFYDPTIITPAEDITIFTSNVAYIRHRKREYTEPTPEQRAQWVESIKQMSTATH